MKICNKYDSIANDRHVNAKNDINPAYCTYLGDQITNHLTTNLTTVSVKTL